MATLLVVLATLILPFTPLGPVLGFSRLPTAFSLLIGIIIMGYIMAAEMAKRVFYRRVKF
jgi:Mg2+-importing ATPase